MEQEKFEKHYIDLLNDNDFERLELLLKQPNIFNILRSQHSELKHSNFLSWLLNPNENHGIGSIFLTKFLRDVLIDKRSGKLSIIELPTLNLEEVRVYREWSNIDILIELPKYVFVIENKVHSGEHSNQLERYKKIIKDKFPNREYIFIYLTPEGSEASLKDEYINYSYEKLIRHLNDIIEINPNSVHPSALKYIKDYIETVNYRIMGNSNINELARKVYLNHKELLDIIIENKPDAWTEFRNYLDKKAKENGWIMGSPGKGFFRFLTPKLNEIIPKGYSNSWAFKETFLFEINFYNPKTLSIYCTVAPGDEEGRKILKEILANIQGSKDPIGKKWYAYFINNIKYNLEELILNENKEIEKFINSFWPIVEDMVAKVEKAILDNRKELEELNSRRGQIKS